MTTQSCRGDLRRPFLRDRAAGRHQADVGVGEIVGVERLHLEDAVAEGDLGPLAAARGERHHLVGGEAALVEDDSISRPTLPVAPATATLKPMTWPSLPVSSRAPSPGRARRAAPPRSAEGEGSHGGSEDYAVLVVFVVFGASVRAPARLAGTIGIEKKISRKDIGRRPRKRGRSSTRTPREVNAGCQAADRSVRSAAA